MFLGQRCSAGALCLGEFLCRGQCWCKFLLAFFAEAQRPGFSFLQITWKFKLGLHRVGGADRGREVAATAQWQGRVGGGGTSPSISAGGAAEARPGRNPGVGAACFARGACRWRLVFHWYYQIRGP